MGKAQLISELAFDLALGGLAHEAAIDRACDSARSWCQADRDFARTLFWARQERLRSGDIAREYAR